MFLCDLPPQVRLRVTTRVINDMHSDEDMRRRVMQDDRWANCWLCMKSQCNTAQ